MKALTFGVTSENLPIAGYQFGSTGPQVLILGGVHGDETEGVQLALGLLKSFAEDFAFRLRLTLVPAFNLDGVLARRRTNGAGVDLNRNLPTRDWSAQLLNPRYPPGPSANSEPENQALVRWLDENQPKMIFSLHSWKPLLNVNGDCLPEAQALHRQLGYGIEETIGYPTPGCLGTYCGIERHMPTLTYEIERGLNVDAILKEHVPAMLEALKVTEQRSH